MKKTLSKLEEIINCIKRDFSCKEGNSLMGGKTGLALLLSYYASVTNNEKVSQQSADVLKMIEDSFEFENQYTFCMGIAGIGSMFLDLLRDNCNKRKKLPKTKIGVDFLTNRQKRRAENSPQNALNLLIFGVFHSSKIPQNFFVEKMFLEANFV